MVLTPNPEALGIKFCSGTSTSSMTICPVMLALSENLPSIFGADKPCNKFKIKNVFYFFESN
jgi:hypothetical protein